MIWLPLLLSAFANAAVLRSHSSNANLSIILNSGTPTLNTKVEVKTIRPYNNTKLYSTYRLPDGSYAVPVVTIADMDKESRENATSWYSISYHGYVFYNPLLLDYKIVWLSSHKYTFPLNNAGRGMEFSDLKSFDGHLLSPDDKTGVVFRLNNKVAIPWIINADGDGEQTSLFKGEWLTVKDEELYLGGYGKEYTDGVGQFLNNNPMWIKVISRFGEIRSENWEDRFKRLRASIGIEFPNYVIHESCQWSQIHRKWFFLPRRVSFQPYNENIDSMKGSNYLITADENFMHFENVRIGQVHLTRGFSAFQFLPETNDTIIIALKSEEAPPLPLATYSIIFRIDGTILLDETKLPGNYKFEGIEFYNWP